MDRERKLRDENWSPLSGIGLRATESHLNLTAVKLNNIYLKDNKMNKTKKTPIKPYTEQALAFFQEQNDQEEFMTEPTNGNYIDYLLGDSTTVGHEGITMDTEFDEMDDSSDWFMD